MMDRQAYYNMTTKVKGNDRATATLNHFSQPTGQMTSKAKINTQLSQYYLERQHKNTTDYSQFVNALDHNIQEDQDRSFANHQTFEREQAQTQTTAGNSFHRIYHPMLDQDREMYNDFDRTAVNECTRDRRENVTTHNKNTRANGIGQWEDQFQPLILDELDSEQTPFRPLHNNCQSHVKHLNQSMVNLPPNSFDPLKFDRPKSSNYRETRTERDIK